MEPEREEFSLQQRPVLTREQKVAYAVVVSCGVLAVVLGFLYIGKHLKSPFTITYEGSHILTSDEKKTQEIERQKKADTDDDGINDYDELYIYDTSPYLEDTDSDGLADAVEISSNGDPNCALGQTCVEASDEEIANTADPTGGLAESSADAAAQAAIQLDELKKMLESLQPSEIRTMLIESGADANEINQMSDEEILELYQTVLQQLETSGDLDTMLQAVGQSAQAQATTN